MKYTPFIKRIIGITLLLLITISVQATEIITNNSFETNTKSWGIAKTKGVTVKRIAIDDLDGVTHGMQATIDTSYPKQSWRCGFYQNSHTFIPKKANITLTFKAKGSDEKILQANVQNNGYPWKNSLTTKQVKLTSQWQTYRFESKTIQDYAPGGLRTYFLFAHDTGWATVADVHLEISGAGVVPVGLPINANDAFQNKLTGWTYNKKTVEVELLKEDNKPFARVTSKSPDAKKFWLCSFATRLASPLKADSKIKITATFRSPTPDAKFELFMEGKGGHKDRMIKDNNIKPTSEWQTMQWQGVVKKDRIANECSIKIFFGHKEQTLDIKNITLSFEE